MQETELLLRPRRLQEEVDAAVGALPRAQGLLGAIVILISAMRQGPSPRRVRELCTRFGADRRTIARWQIFWREHFPQTPFWKIARAGLVPVRRDHLPAVLARGCLPLPPPHLQRLDPPAAVSLTDRDPRRPANRGLAMIAFHPQKMLVANRDQPVYRGCHGPFTRLVRRCDDTNTPRLDRRLVARFRFSVVGSLLSSPPCAERSNQRSALLPRRPGRIL